MIVAEDIGSLVVIVADATLLHHVDVVAGIYWPARAGSGAALEMRPEPS